MSLLVAGATSASGASSTKYYTLSAPPSVAVGTTSLTVTLANCGSGAGCPKPSQQAFGSARITTPASLGLSGWSVATSAPAKAADWRVVQEGDALLLVNVGTGSSDAIAPGESLAVTLTFPAIASGQYTFTSRVKQSNDFSGTGNDFLTSTGNAKPGLTGSVTVYVGVPHHLEYVTQPSTVEVYGTPLQPWMKMCAPPSVRVVDADGATVTWLQGLAVTLTKPPTQTANPGLTFVQPTGTTTTITATTVNGVATFGDCADSYLRAGTLGLAYRLVASASWPTSASPLGSATSTPFDVLPVHRPFNAFDGCLASLPGSHTQVDVGTPDGTCTADYISLSVALAQTPLSCSSPEVLGRTVYETVVLNVANNQKLVTLTYDKQVVNSITNNGTPFWPVCFGAPYAFPTVSGYTQTGATGGPDWEGLLVDCDATVAGWTPGTYPCVVSRNKQAAKEIVVVSVPDVTHDPRMV